MQFLKAKIRDYRTGADGRVRADTYLNLAVRPEPAEYAVFVRIAASDEEVVDIDVVRATAAAVAVDRQAEEFAQVVYCSSIFVLNAEQVYRLMSPV